MEIGEKIKQKIFEILKNKKSVETIIIIVVVAVIISIYISTLSRGQEDPSPKESVQGTFSAGGFVQEMEERLEKTLQTISGAGKVKVMITLETTEEMVPAMDTQMQTTVNENEAGQSASESRTESSKPVTVQQQSGAEAVVITQKQPKVRGVIIIAQGAEDVGVKMDLLKAAQTVLNVSAEKVDVFTMNHND